jgi:threonine/homoserine/homoserine lactone efflux protein
MIDSGVLATYVVVLIGLLLIPGPAVLLTLARSISGGRRVGIATGLGIAIGDLGHTALSSLGLSALLATSALAFAILKYCGAAYLVFLGVRAFIEKTATLSVPKTRAIGPAAAFRQGILTEILNPKTALFFLAFLPQFVHPENGPAVLQFAQLGIIFVSVGIPYTVAIALSAGSIGKWLASHPGIGRWQGKAIGSIFIGLGVRLALQER